MLKRMMLTATALTGALMGAAPLPAAAQTAAPAQSAADGAAPSDGEIIVTARRREENLQDVPIAVTVVSQEALDDNNIQTVGQLQYLVPSMTATSVYTRDSVNLSLRGQQATATSTVQAVVAYLNEAPLPTTIGGDVAGGPGMFFDLERVQVLKGPQGTLFGRNTTGGAVQFETARPDEELGGFLQVGVGNYNNREVNGYLNLPLVGDTLLMRIAAAGQIRDGFTDVLGDPNHTGSFDADNRDWFGVRDTLTFRPNNAFRNDLIVSYSEYDSNGSPNILTAVNPSGLLATFFPDLITRGDEQAALDERTAIAESVPLVSGGDNLAIQNITRVDLSDNVTFRNIVAYDQANAVLTQDFDGTDLPILDNITEPREYADEQFSEEAQFLGTTGNLEWVLGAFYLTNEWDWIQPTNYFASPAATYKQDEQTSTAVFAQGTYDLSSIVEGLKLTAGGRYTWDTEDILIANCTAPDFTVCPGGSTYSADSEAFTWTLGLDYQLNDDTLIYVTSRRGYRAGSFNSQLNAPAYDPEFVTDVEVGIKANASLGQMPLRLNIAAYHQDYEDIQVIQSTLVPPGGLVLITQNAGEARINGAEVEGLLHLTDNLEVGATFSWLDFEYTSFGPGVNEALLRSEASYNRPEYKYGLSARYHVLVSPNVGDITLGANWNWQDETVALGNDAADHSDPEHHDRLQSFGILNLSANWERLFGSAVDASLFVSNATDETYPIGGVSTYPTLGYSVTRYGEPRMYGLRLGYHFGADQ